MANYNKSFNFRNGVQVDTDDLIVRGSLVGIGTTIPKSDLDVYGNVNVTGLVTSQSLYIAGVATFNQVNIGTGITIYGTSGIISAVSFSGDGSNLEGLPTSKWQSYQSGIATSIYADAPFVGIGTTNPTASLQIGGRTEIGSSGVAISTDGHINASGIITANSFSGEGTNLTAINASNVTVGNLPAAVFPSQITVSGIATIASLDATLINSSGIATISQLEATQSNISGIATVGFATISAGYVNGLTVGVATVTDLTITGGSSVSNLGVTNINSTGIVTTTLLVSSDANVSGFTTLGGMSAGTGTIETLISTNTNITGIITAVDANITGTTTVGLATGEFAHIGIATIATLESSTAIRPTVDLASDLGSATSYFKRAYIGEVNVGAAASNEITTRSGNLVLDSATGRVVVDDNLEVTGIATITGDATLNTAIISTEIKPEQNHGASIGTATNYFETGFVGDVNIGVGNSGLISTRFSDLTLDSVTNKVIVNNNLQVNGISTLTGNTTLGTAVVTTEIKPDQNHGATIGTATDYFETGFIGDVNIGVGNSALISTRFTNLVLDSATGRVVVDNNLEVTGITTINGDTTLSTAVITSEIKPDQNHGATIGTATDYFETGFIGDVNIGVGNSGLISTRNQDLTLDAASDQVVVDGRLRVTGVTTFEGNVNVDGDINLGVITITDSLSHTGDTDTRIRFPVEDAYTVETGGSERIRVNNGGLTVTGLTTTTQLEVTGSSTLTGNVTASGDLAVTGDLRGGSAFIPNVHLNAGIGTEQNAFSNAFINDVTIGVGNTYRISTRFNKLELDSANGVVQVSSKLKVDGQSYFTGIATVATSLVPDADQDAALGSASLRFSDAYIDNIQIGVGSDNKITTSANNLTLAGASYVETEGDFHVSGNALVVGVSTLTGSTTLTGGAVPAADKGSNLGSASAAFGGAHVNEIRIGIAETNKVDTREGNLRLGAETRKVIVDDSLTVSQATNLSDLYVDTNVFSVDTVDNRVGVGTSAPTNTVTIVNETDSATVEVVSNDGAARISVGSSTGTGAGTSFGKFEYENKTLSVTNRDSGGMAFTINDSAIDPTESSNYRFTYSGDTLLSIGYSGVTGVNKADATETLDVNGSLKSQNATVVGILTVGTGANQISFGATSGFEFTGIMSSFTPDGVAAKGNVFVESGISTFFNLETDDESIVTIGGTFSVVGVASAANVAFGATTTNDYSKSTEFNQGNDKPVLVLTGDSIFDGSILISEDDGKLGIGTTGFSVDSRNIDFDSVNQSAVQTEFGALEVHGGASLYGSQTIFNNSLLDPGQQPLSPIDKDELTDYTKQHRVGINTFQPRACLDLGGSKSPMILPSLSGNLRQEYADSNESTVSAPWMVNSFDSALDQSGFTGIPGTLFFNEETKRPEVGINTGGQYCGIATLTNSFLYPALAAFQPPVNTTAQSNDLIAGGTPDGALIYNVNTNRIEMKITIGITTHWVGLATVA
jgi:hypothetical protein